jgi:hypothetical protein
MAVVNIDYNDGNKKDLGYKYVELDYNNLKTKKIFDTGNFVKDWYDCIKFCITKIQNKEHVGHSSSVNHFFMDGAKYDSAYLVMNGDNGKLSYDEKQHGDEIEFFVEEGTTPTWEELKELCGDTPTTKKVKSKKSIKL